MPTPNPIEHTLSDLLQAAERALQDEELARRRGLLQNLDPRVKVCGLLSLVVAAAVSRHPWVIVLLFAVSTALAAASGISPRLLATREWLPVLCFTGAIALPALFLTTGSTVAHLPLLGWAISNTGVRTALMLLARVETAATLAVLLVLCTPWTHVLKAMRALGAPVVLVAVLGMTQRYIFLLLGNAADLLEARRSRLVGTLDRATARRISTASIGVLLGKTIYLGNEVFLAMQSRGFAGDNYTLDEFAMRRRDWAGAAAFAALAVFALWYGH